jgi:uncharacterized repeat protein (TIGR01451 family)
VTGTISGLKVNLSSIPYFPPARPGFEAIYDFVVENEGTTKINDSLVLIYDDRLVDFVEEYSQARSINPGRVVWNTGTIDPFTNKRFKIKFRVNSPMDIPAVNSGDVLPFYLNLDTFKFVLNNTVVGSYDPNDKTCLQGDRIAPSMIGSYVDYLIRFENTGDFYAENIVVRDIIDTTMFDINTLRVTSSSHAQATNLVGNKVEFIFKGIKLPAEDDMNDGYVAFEIKTKLSVKLNDSIKNEANIYFDYNFPILTNTATTVVKLPSNNNEINFTSFDIVPSLTIDQITLMIDETIHQIIIYDKLGRKMEINGDKTSIDVKSYPNGIYFVKVLGISGRQYFGRFIRI